MQWESGNTKAKPLRRPWWLSGKEPAHQCRGRELNPWSERTPHTAGGASPRAATTEACVAHDLRSAEKGAAAMRSARPATREEPSLTETGEMPRTSTPINKQSYISKAVWTDDLNPESTLNHGDMLLRKFYSNFIEEPSSQDGTWVFHLDLIFLNWARALTLSHSSLQGGKSRDLSQH